MDGGGGRGADREHVCWHDIISKDVGWVRRDAGSFCTPTMEAKVDAAVASNDHAALASVFSPLGGWQSLGQGAQKVLASYFIKKAVSTAGFLPGAFASDQAMSAFAAALGHLPPTVEGAADNKLRESMFEYKVGEEGDYSGAARILAGLRMDDTEGSVYYMSAAHRCDGKLHARMQ